jgi:serine/threonine protein kinase
LNENTLRELKNFKLLNQVGEGACGTVWSALHKESLRKFAIKVVEKAHV